MIRWHHAVAIVVGVLLALFAAVPPAAAEQFMKHSGTIVGIDRTTHKITVAEVGPWRVERGKTVTTPLVIEVGTTTELTMVHRAPDTATGFPGDFVEEPLEAWDLFFFDYVTVDCLHKDGRMIALKITVLGPDTP